MKPPFALQKPRLFASLALAAALAAPANAQTIAIDDNIIAAEAETQTAPPATRFELEFGDGAALVSPEELSAEGTLLAPEPIEPQLQYGVVSTAHPEASWAGMNILQKGGNALDAAMAVMLALTVVEPQSSGIGGGGFLLYQDAASGQLHTLDGREMAPASAAPTRFLHADGSAKSFAEAAPGGLSVGVPGNLQLMHLAHENWGKLPWADLFTPAIQLAEGGFEVNKALAERLAATPVSWAQFPEARKIYWKGLAPALQDDEILNPELSATFTRLAAQGASEFYSGQTGQEIARTVRTSPVNPGDITAIDLSAYSALERAPVCMDYRSYKICGMGPPSSGAASVLQTLGMLAPFDLSTLGPQNPQSWYLIGQSMQLAYADRAAYLGDGDFVNVPIAGLLAPEYLAQRSGLISPVQARADYPAGTPAMAEPRPVADSGIDEGTSHFVIVDAQGNIASMTSTIEGPFGSQLVSGGFFLNNELTDFNFEPVKDGMPTANAVAGGKRPLSSMAPTIVYDAQGRPVLAIGSAGGKRIISHVIKTLIGVIDFGLPLDEAIALPNIYFSPEGLQVEEGSFLADMADPLTGFGQNVTIVKLPSKLNGAQWTQENGWRGAADLRSEGTVLAQ